MMHNVDLLHIIDLHDMSLHHINWNDIFFRKGWNPHRYIFYFHSHHPQCISLHIIHSIVGFLSLLVVSFLSNRLSNVILTETIEQHRASLYHDSESNGRYSNYSSFLLNYSRYSSYYSKKNHCWQRYRSMTFSAITSNVHCNIGECLVQYYNNVQCNCRMFSAIWIV